MKSGRISLVAILVGLGLVFLVGVILFSSNTDSPETAAIKFMDALARGDANDLSQVTSIDEDSPEVVRKKWENTLSYTEFYQFQWAYKGPRHSTRSISSFIAPTSSAPIRESRTSAGGTRAQKYRWPILSRANRSKSCG
jgi:hypothetical protein